MKTSSMYTLVNHQLVLMRFTVGSEERLNSMFIIQEATEVPHEAVPIM